jgi:hypothetical protein
LPLNLQQVNLDFKPLDIFLVVLGQVCFTISLLSWFIITYMHSISSSSFSFLQLIPSLTHQKCYRRSVWFTSFNCTPYLTMASRNILRIMVAFVSKKSIFSFNFFFFFWDKVGLLGSSDSPCSVSWVGGTRGLCYHCLTHL